MPRNRQRDPRRRRGGAAAEIALLLPFLAFAFVLVWLLRFMGLEPEIEYKEEEDGAEGRDEGGGMRAEGKDETRLGKK